MSGPKVINIEARRAQLERQGLRNLRALGLIMNDIASSGLDEGEIETLKSHAQGTLQELNILQQRKDWESLAEKSQSYVQFFSTTLHSQRENQKHRQSQKFRRRQMMLVGCPMILAECDKLGIARPPVLEELVSGTKAIDVDRAEKEMSAILTRVAKAKAEISIQQANSQLRTFAQTLQGPNDRIITIDQWFKDRSSREQSDELDKVTELLRDLAGWCTSEQLVRFQKKSDQITCEVDSSRRRLLFDSFTVELAEERRRHLDRSEAIRTLENALVLLAAFTGAEAEGHERRVTTAIRKPELKVSKLIFHEVEEWCKSQQTKLDSTIRRETVLRALAALGYEVREGMSLAWAADGKIVVQKPSVLGYGIELTMPSQTESMQVRVVAFRDAAQISSSQKLRDKEMEEKWCSEFHKLRSMLENDGYAVKLKHMVGPGQQQVKAVGSKAAAEMSSKRDVPHLKAKTS